MKVNKLSRLIPFLIWSIVMGYTWVTILATEYFATARHIIALSIFFLNLILYFIRFNAAVILTGIALLLATFNLLAFFPDIVSTSYFIRLGAIEITAPAIQWKSLFLLLLYVIVNAKFLIGLYSNYRQRE
jgi:hypothetical protein